MGVESLEHIVKASIDSWQILTAQEGSSLTQNVFEQPCLNAETYLVSLPNASGPLWAAIESAQNRMEASFERVERECGCERWKGCKLQMVWLFLELRRVCEYGTIVGGRGF